MQADDPTVSLTKEPSGEIRLTVRVPERHGKRRQSHMATVAKRQDAAHLSVAAKSEISTGARSGFGRTPGRTEFGRFAKRAIKNAVGALKSLHGKRIVFATLTLPGSTKEARQALADWSAKATELLQHWILYHAPQAVYAYVWERQKSGALHWHCAIGTADVLALRYLEQNFQEYAHQLFVTLSNLSGVDMFARAAGGSWRGCVQVLKSNCEPVRKCVKRYMAKYLTKQAGAEQAYCPARWWGYSRGLRAVVRSLRHCTRRKTSSLALTVWLLETARTLTKRRGYTTFSFSSAYSPHSRTTLIYPPDDDVDWLYGLLSKILHGANETLTYNHPLGRCGDVRCHCME